MTRREKTNPCLTCGACCAYYRASFYWAECDDAVENGVPHHLTKKMDFNRRMMLGTGGPEPRCIALLGTIGEEVRCLIYERRASVCRSFVPSWENAVPNQRCDKARTAWNLKPLMPDHWEDGPQNLPRAA
jgi:Fe-S-cluster containining protein